MPIVDRSGQRFGLLTVLRLHSKGDATNYWMAKWVCRCDCGKEVVKPVNSLNPKGPKSCGCLQGGPTHRATNTPLDRMNNNLGYWPWNCRWATREEQRANQRNHNQYTVTA